MHVRGTLRVTDLCRLSQQRDGMLHHTKEQVANPGPVVPDQVREQSVFDECRSTDAEWKGTTRVGSFFAEGANLPHRLEKQITTINILRCIWSLCLSN